MKHGLPFVLAGLICSSLAQLPAQAEDQPAFANADARDKVGYAIGINVGMNLTNNLKRANFDVNPDQIVSAIKDMLTGKELKMTDAQARETITAYQQQRTREITEKNLKAGEAFLAENKTKEGVKTKEVALAEGKTAEFQYKVITEGDGAIPTATDKVKVKYRGTLVDGTEFDSTAKRGGQPALLGANQVIRGWSEALQMMKTGSKWELYIPASLAYGETPRPGIEPGSTLIFEVELVEINSPAPEPTTSQPKPLTSDIIRVPSAEEMKAGAKIEVIKASDLEKSNAVQNATSGEKKN
jgi:FKBP-type peptidyl-prolyl cis-trans isomerase